MRGSSIGDTQAGGRIALTVCAAVEPIVSVPLLQPSDSPPLRLMRLMHTLRTSQRQCQARNGLCAAVVEL